MLDLFKPRHHTLKAFYGLLCILIHLARRAIQWLLVFQALRQIGAIPPWRLATLDGSPHLLLDLYEISRLRLLLD